MMGKGRGAIAALVFGLVGLATAADARADAFGKPFGMGLILGSPTGLSAKTFVAGDHAIDVAVGLDVIAGNRLRAHSDYLWQIDLVDNDKLEMAFTPGLGLGIDIKEAGKKSGYGRLFLRFPAGLVFYVEEFKRKGVPVDLFIEAAPGVSLMQGGGFDISGGLGARYWF